MTKTPQTQSDEALALAAQAGDEAALTELLARYRGTVWIKSASYFLAGGEHDDVVQEGMIGLYKAIRDFDPERPASFRSFADLCITRQIQTAVKLAARQKHQQLNRYVSLSAPDSADDTPAFDFPDESFGVDPARVAEHREFLEGLAESINTLLSELEKQVLFQHLNGKSYQEIATEMDKQVKSIDNALQRVKRKLDTVRRQEEE
jgi:RNA polymerase sporulation-specific sigma factor